MTGGLCAVLAVGLLACGNSPAKTAENPNPAPALVPCSTLGSHVGAARSLPINAEGIPVKFRVWSQSLTDRLDWKQPFQFDDPVAVEFIAFADRPVGSTVELWTEIKGVRTKVGETRPGVHDAKVANGPAAAALVSSPVRIDLSACGSEVFKLSWSLNPPLSEGAVEIADVRFSPVQPPDSTAAPDILFICSDAHREDFATAGDGVELMPQLQALAARGVVFDHAYSNASWTLPSVTSVMTGLFPRYHTTGRVDLEGFVVGGKSPPAPEGRFLAAGASTFKHITSFPSSLTTLTEVLQERGYITAIISANPFYMISGMHQEGVDVYGHGRFERGAAINEAVRALLESLPRDRPLFLLVHYLDVHDFVPFYFIPEHKTINHYRAPREMLIESYSKAVRECDKLLGEALGMWRVNRNAEGSLIAFYADHGEHIFDPGHPPVPPPPDENAPADPAVDLIRIPVLNHGNSMQDELLHVPLVVKFPESAGIAPGVCGVPVSLVDLFPTATGLAGREGGTDGLNGDSLVKCAGSSPPKDRDIMADYQLNSEEMSSVRRNQFKLVLNLARRKQWLVDEFLPYLPDGESGQMAANDAVAAELRATYDAYSKDAARATTGLVGGPLTDPDEAMKGIKGLQYVK